MSPHQGRRSSWHAPRASSMGEPRGRAKGPRSGRRRAGLVVALVVGIIAAALPTVTAPPADATYATGGSGLYLGAIDWFDWGTPDVAVTNGMSRTNTRTIGGSVIVTTCTLTNEIGDVGTYRPGQWQGDSLENLYNVGGTGTANTLIDGLYNFVDGALVGFDVSCTVTLDGVPAPIQGLVVADAEASNDYPNTSLSDEYIQVRPLQPSTWRIIDRYRDCDTSVLAQLAADSTLRLAPNGTECTYNVPNGSGPMVVGFMEGATSARVTLQGGGRSAVAVGVVLESDFGDAPLSYGGAGAVYDGNWGGGVIPVGTTNVSVSTFGLATPVPPPLRLGATIDSDSAPGYSANATGDDLLKLDDEDAVGALAPLTALPGTAYTISVACTGTGFVSGWIDFNRNGVFDTGEKSNAPACAAGTASLSWTLPANVVAGDTFLRLRIAPDLASLVAVGVRFGGEVEDHMLRINPTILLQKSYPSGRIAPLDQAALTVQTGGSTVGTTATTTGAEVGVQNQSPAEYVGPVAATVGASYTISESMATGSVSTAADYTSIWSCTDTVGTPLVSGSGVTGTFTFPDVAVQKAKGIVCTFSNAIAPVSITVTKNWIVDGVAYANGAQPTGLTAQLLLTGPASAGATNQDWAVARGGYVRGSAATVTETVQLLNAWANCTTTAAVTQLNGAATNVALTAAGYGTTLNRLSTTMQITNTVTCAQNLTLVKSVAFGDEPTSSWTLNAQAPTGALTGPTGTHSDTTPVTGAVSPEVAYVLTEAGGPDTYVAVGGWACVLTDDGITPVAATNGSVTIPRGLDVTCTITNSTATITVLKHVIDPMPGFEANAWNVTATPAALAGGSLPIETRAGAESDVAGANMFEVRPGHGYSLSESSTGPTLAYRQVAVEKFDGTNWVPISSADIVAPAAGENAVYRFVNERIPAVMLPLTGGTSADAYLIGGGVVLAMALAGALWTSRRRRFMR